MRKEERKRRKIRERYGSEPDGRRKNENGRGGNGKGKATCEEEMRERMRRGRKIQEAKRVK